MNAVLVTCLLAAAVSADESIDRLTVVAGSADYSADTRKDALLELGRRLGEVDEKKVLAICDAILDEREEARIEAAGVYGGKGGRTSPELTAKIVRSNLLMPAAVRVIGATGPTAAPRLVSLLERKPQFVNSKERRFDVDLNREVFLELKRLGEDAREVAPRLVALVRPIDYLDPGQANSRRLPGAVECLIEMNVKADEIVPQLITVLKAPSGLRLNSKTKQYTTHSGERLKGVDTTTVLSAWSNDKRVVLKALKHYGSESRTAVPALVSLLEEQILVDQVIPTLGAIGPDAAEALPFLRKMLQSDVGRDGKMLEDAIGKIREDAP